MPYCRTALRCRATAAIVAVSGLAAAGVAATATQALARPRPVVPRALARPGPVVPRALARPGPVVPRAGDWEGVGAHGLPLSFELVRRRGRLVATSIALGSPLWCPASERDAEAVPLFAVAYGGPGGGLANGGSPPAGAVLSGRVPGGSSTASLTGRFDSARSGTLTTQVDRSVGCGWPAVTLTWRVHPARRQPVRDGTWSGALSGPGITTGIVRLLVVDQGRVVNSVSAAFHCRDATSVGNNSFAVSPTYEFIRPSGQFYSPLGGNAISGYATTWSGRFSSAGGLTGTLSIYDACTKHLVRARFAGAWRGPAAVRSGRRHRADLVRGRSLFLRGSR